MCDNYFECAAYMFGVFGVVGLFALIPIFKQYYKEERTREDKINEKIAIAIFIVVVICIIYFGVLPSF